MIVTLPIVLLLAGVVGAYLRDGWLRVGATLAILLATAGSLALVLDARTGASWLIGPVLSTLLVGRERREDRLSFEALTRRAVTLAATSVVAIFLATKFPLGENPVLLSAVPWFCGAVGAAWLISPVDARERTQGQVLLVGAGAALLIAAVPVGAITAAASGLMALVPAIASRWTLPPLSRSVLAAILLTGAAVVAALALLPGTLPHPAIKDLSFSLDGPSLPATALLLVIGALSVPSGSTWVVVPGLVALLAVAPSLRWAALAALVAVQSEANVKGERATWLGLLLLASSTMFGSLTAQAWSLRAQTVGLAAALVLMAMGASRRGSVLALAATALAIMQDTSTANAGLIARFQWVTAAGAALLVTRALIARRGEAPARTRLDEEVTLGLLLLAVAAHDPFGLGALAALLLLVDLALIRHGPASVTDLERSHRLRWFADLTASGWPPAVRFAAGTLAVIAALQTSLSWGLLAALLLVLLKLGPIIDPVAAGGEARSRPPLRALIAPLIALLCGIAPALMLRMLRV